MEVVDDNACDEKLSPNDIPEEFSPTKIEDVPVDMSATRDEDGGDEESIGDIPDSPARLSPEEQALADIAERAKFEDFDWYQDAKLGVFIHWGVWTVPAFAPRGRSFHEAAATKDGMDSFLKNNPYSEWYWNTMKIPGSDTENFHRENFGNAPYTDFKDEFRKQSEVMSAKPWGDLFSDLRAKYVVMVTKHHDGYTMYPSETKNPFIEDWQSERDFVGEVCSEVKNRGMRFGVYYSGGPDWTFNDTTINTISDIARSVPQSQQYVEYVIKHWTELINRYEPSILWNDIGTPSCLPVEKITRYMKTKHRDGVVCDRFMHLKAPSKNSIADKLFSWAAKKALNPNSLMRSLVRATMDISYDFETPEFAQYDRPQKQKWETCRGLGRSFGYNANENSDDLISAVELTRMFVDIVSKNGNLLINPAFRADGSIPEEQLQILKDFSEWMDHAGQGVFATRCCDVAERESQCGRPLRFLRHKNDQEVFVYIFGLPESDEIVIPKATIESSGELLGRLVVGGGLEGVPDVYVSDFKDSTENIVIRIQDDRPLSSLNWKIPVFAIGISAKGTRFEGDAQADIPPKIAMRFKKYVPKNRNTALVPKNQK